MDRSTQHGCAGCMPGRWRTRRWSRDGRCGSSMGPTGRGQRQGPARIARGNTAASGRRARPVERLPNKKLPPRPLWLAWIGGPLPADLSVLWRWYLRRFTVEHAFRFFKQTLGWTTVRPRHADAADRWTWLIAAACWQLWLARPLVSEVRLPWEHPRPDGLVTPGQVQRHFTGILVRMGTPARAPRKRGKSPGRRKGQRPVPALHYEVARRTPRRAA